MEEEGTFSGKSRVVSMATAADLGGDTCGHKVLHTCGQCAQPNTHMQGHLDGSQPRPGPEPLQSTHCCSPCLGLASLAALLSVTPHLCVLDPGRTEGQKDRFRV